ncbi:MAG: anti-phage dCTP deaminase [Gemmatimonadetes bacterium]|nr:anti-phage dCTP deaminase [Gemmatimonadota bacterium]
MSLRASETPTEIERPDSISLSPQHLLSPDLVVGLIGFAGAGCTDVYTRLDTFLSDKGFSICKIKLSECIGKCFTTPLPDIDRSDGVAKLTRAVELQNAGDALRERYGAHAVASLAIREIKALRRVPSDSRRAIILDSLKHPAEVELLRLVYERSFLLMGVYCDSSVRSSRLRNKFYRADPSRVDNFIDRDERDRGSTSGQQVKLAFHLSDFFLDNSADRLGHDRVYDADLKRIVDIMDGGSLVRPTAGESAMYAAYSAAHRSSCLSRQVGAAITSPTGEVLATGTNDVPAYGGGVYHDGHAQEHNRCFKWKWWQRFADGLPDTMKVPLCHNTRKKNDLKQEIVRWMAASMPKRFAEYIYPRAEADQLDYHDEERSKIEHQARRFFDHLAEVDKERDELLDDLPGIGDLIEYSRSIHAEMDAVLAAARSGAQLQNGSVYVTTYPCHNCARHLLAVGIKEVRFLEPYEKSLAVTLHWDSIENEGSGEHHMSIRPYTGVGPRVYEQYFLKNFELKDSRTGKVTLPDTSMTRVGVRLLDLDQVEDMAINKIPSTVVL